MIINATYFTSIYYNNGTTTNGKPVYISDDHFVLSYGEVWGFVDPASSQSYGQEVSVSLGELDWPENHGDWAFMSPLQMINRLTICCPEEPFIPPDPVDCVWEYEEWGDCSATCGGGVRSRSITIITRAVGNGIWCPDPLIETESCNTVPCAVDCVWEWTIWSTCSATCGGATRTRNVVVITQPSNGGQECPTDTLEQEICAPDPCPTNAPTGPPDVDCDWYWTEWSSCSTTCGPGIESRMVVVNTFAVGNGEACPAISFETRTCELVPCTNRPTTSPVCAPLYDNCDYLDDVNEQLICLKQRITQLEEENADNQNQLQVYDETCANVYANIERILQGTCEELCT